MLWKDASADNTPLRHLGLHDDARQQEHGGDGLRGDGEAVVRFHRLHGRGRELEHHFLALAAKNDARRRVAAEARVRRADGL